MKNNFGKNNSGIGTIIFVCFVIIFDIAYIVHYNIENNEKARQQEEERRKRKEASERANKIAWSKGETKGRDMSYLNLIPSSSSSKSSSSKSSSSRSSSSSNSNSSKSSSSKSKSYKYDPYDVSSDYDSVRR